MSDAIFEKLKLFIRNQGVGYALPYPFLFKKKEITPNTSLATDLGINGDDAEEFLIAFSKEFNVDVALFPTRDYFQNEGDRLLPSLIKLFTGKKNIPKRILTVGDLEKAIISGRLDEETINSSLSPESPVVGSVQ